MHGFDLKNTVSYDRFSPFNRCLLKMTFNFALHSFKL